MSTLSLWSRRDPFTAFDSFDALVRSAFGPAARPTEETGFGFTPAAEIVREGDDAIVRVEVPGLDPQKDVTVELDHGRLVVRGERRDETTREQGGRSLRELRYGSFRRSFGLADQVSADAISATYDAGVLSVRISGAYRRPSGQARQIAVTPSPAPSPEIEPATMETASQDPAGPAGVITLRRPDTLGRAPPRDGSARAPAPAPSAGQQATASRRQRRSSGRRRRDLGWLVRSLRAARPPEAAFPGTRVAQASLRFDWHRATQWHPACFPPPRRD